jgi:eukaryotic-like serine/threonine-protein kinase
MADDVEKRAPERKGRYVLYDRIAAGGMATVHLGRLVGAGGFGRTVAIKRLHPHLAMDREFAAMLLDEARIAARLRHPNVVHTIDVVDINGEVLLVMEYVHGASLSALLRLAMANGKRIPPEIAATIVCDLLRGLHAAHEAVDEWSVPLGIVHRDVSPQNVLVGADGISRVVDFGIAKAAGRLQQTDDGKVKGKLSYMSPEQLGGGALDRRSDVYAASIVLWETLTGQSLFGGPGGDVSVQKVMQHTAAAPSTVSPGITKAFDEVVLRGLRREARQRFPSARDMALALEQCGHLATPSAVAAWVEETAENVLKDLAGQVANVERADADSSTGPFVPALHPELATETVSAMDTGAMAPRMQRPRRSRASLVAASAALFVALGIAAIVVRSRAEIEPLPAAALLQSSAHADNGTEAAIAIGTTAGGVAATASGGAPADESAGAPSATPQSLRPPARARSPVPRRGAKKQCAQPYVLDADGVKHYKLDCL